MLVKVLSSDLELGFVVWIGIYTAKKEKKSIPKERDWYAENLEEWNDMMCSENQYSGQLEWGFLWNETMVFYHAKCLKDIL
jgi:hypothetical protein